MSRENNRPKARVKKETIRKLDLRTLAPSDLANVVGGRPPYTAQACIGCP